jgi:predicted transcriptional regulator
MAAKDRRVTVRLPDEVFVRLSEKAARNDVSVAWLIRRMIDESLGTRERPEAKRVVEPRLK